MNQKILAIGIFALGIMSFWYLKTSDRDQPRFIPAQLTQALIFGDDFLNQVNSIKTDNYDFFLQSEFPKLSVDVVSKKGETTQSALKTVSENIFHSSPQLVLVSPGLEDLRQGYSLGKTIENLERIFDAFHERKMLVAYIGVALPATGDNWLMSIRQTCKQKGVLYIDSPANSVFANDSMTSELQVNKGELPQIARTINQSIKTLIR